MRLISLLLSVSCLFAACRTPSPPRPMPELDASALVSAMLARADAAAGLRAHARISIDAPGLDVSRPQRLAVERPDSLRVEILGLFHQIAAVLVVRDGHYQLWESGTKEVQQGRVTSALLWRVARVALTPEEAVDLMLGSPGLVPWLDLGPARWQGDRFVVERLGGGGILVERLRFDADGRLRGFERFASTGELVWSATFDDHRPLMGGDGAMRSFAHTVRLRFPLEEARVDVEYGEVQLDPELSPSLFELAPARRREDGAAPN